MLLGEDGVKRLTNAKVIVFGVGGVGGYAVEALARAGVGHIELVDSDAVSVSNINRQIIATHDTVGKFKTEAMADRIHSINPDCQVVALPLFITKENAEAMISEWDPDAVVDCIDNVSAKIAMIVACTEQKRYIFSSMGTGNKLNGGQLKVADIYSTSGCALARVMRKELKERGIKKLPVVFSEESRPADGRRVPATVAYMPAIAGLLISEQVMKHIIK